MLSAEGVQALSALIKLQLDISEMYKKLMFFQGVQFALEIKEYIGKELY